MRLHDDDLLTYCLTRMQWIWESLDEIRTQYQSTDNVGDLMQNKLENHAKGRACLPVAACLGSTFSSTALRHVCNKLKEAGPDSADEMEASPEQQLHKWDLTIQACIDDGFLEAATNGEEDDIRFVHDKIREAALTFVGTYGVPYHLRLFILIYFLIKLTLISNRNCKTTNSKYRLVTSCCK